MKSSTERVDAAIFKALCAAANAGDRCPTNRDLADLAGLMSVSGPSKTMVRLARAGLISFKSYQCDREVTITATGRKTACYSQNIHWRDRADRGRISLPAAAPGERNFYGPLKSDPPIPAERNGIGAPCWRCAVRADIGCAHQVRDR